MTFFFGLVCIGITLIRVFIEEIEKQTRIKKRKEDDRLFEERMVKWKAERESYYKK